MMRFLFGSICCFLVGTLALANDQSTLEQEVLADQVIGKAALISDQEALREFAKLGEGSPLELIGKENVEPFIDSAVFSEFGLASMDSRFLDGLSLTEGYRFLQLFGWERYTLAFGDILHVSSALDHDLLATLPEDELRMCPPMEPQVQSKIGTDAEQFESTRCYDPRCILRNNQCTTGCMPWQGATCNICRC